MRSRKQPRKAERHGPSGEHSRNMECPSKRIQQKQEECHGEQPQAQRRW